MPSEATKFISAIITNCLTQRRHIKKSRRTISSVWRINTLAKTIAPSARLSPIRLQRQRRRAEVNSHELPRKSFRHESQKDAEDHANDASDYSRAGLRAVSGDVGVAR